MVLIVNPQDTSKFLSYKIQATIDDTIEKTYNVMDNTLQKRRGLLKEATSPKNYHEPSPFPPCAVVTSTAATGNVQTLKSGKLIYHASKNGDAEEKINAQFEFVIGSTSTLSGTGAAIQSANKVGWLLSFHFLSCILSIIGVGVAAIQFAYETTCLHRQKNFEKDFDFQTLDLLKKTLDSKQPNKKDLKKLISGNHLDKLAEDDQSTFTTAEDDQSTFTTSDIETLKSFVNNKDDHNWSVIRPILNRAALPLLKKNLKSLQEEYFQLELDDKQKQKIEKKVTEAYYKVQAKPKIFQLARQVIENKNSDKASKKLLDKKYKKYLTESLGKDDYEKLQDLKEEKRNLKEVQKILEEKIAPIGQETLQDLTNKELDKVLSQQLKTLAKRVRPWCASEVNEKVPGLIEKLDTINLTKSTFENNLDIEEAFEESFSLIDKVKTQSDKEKAHIIGKMVVSALLFALAVIFTVSGVGIPFYALLAVCVLLTIYISLRYYGSRDQLGKGESSFIRKSLDQRAFYKTLKLFQQVVDNRDPKALRKLISSKKYNYLFKNHPAQLELLRDLAKPKLVWDKHHRVFKEVPLDWDQIHKNLEDVAYPILKEFLKTTKDKHLDTDLYGELSEGIEKLKKSIEDYNKNVESIQLSFPSVS